MKTFVVVYVNLLDNSIESKQCEAQCWKSALKKTYAGVYDFVGQAETLEDACDMAFDGEMLIDVVEVK